MTETENEPQSVSRKHYYIDSLVGKFSVIEVLPRQQKSDIPVVIAPGWSESSEVYDLSQSVLAEKGRRSFSFDHPRLGGKVTPNPNYPTPELRKAQTLLDLIDHTGNDKVDVIAHSEGAIYSVIAALLKPQKFRNIVFIAPGGMISQDTLPALMARFSKKVTRNLIQGITDRKTTKTVVRSHIGAAKYIATNPVRAINEVLAISKATINQLLPELRSQGIGIVVIHHADDKAFPMRRIQNVANSEQMDGILSVTGLHDDLYTHPQEYTAAAEEMLSALERKQANQKITSNLS